ncbi:MAG: pitrilysin family protein [Candidatus Undinarchaeales archaeon]|nr:pitrilysin family protein [Candidatus Undinarchaeales archaeon]
MPPVSPQPESIVLDNGLRVLLLPTRAHTVGIAIGIDVGSVHETPGQAGIAHAVEHCVFRGTRSRSPFELTASVERAGGMLNAWTVEENTVFYASMPPQGWQKGLDALADIVISPAFPEKGVERELAVILEEVSSVDDDPAELVWHNALGALYGDHPAGRDVLGTAATVRRLKAEDLAAFHAKNYTPDSMVVSIAGSFSKHDVQERITRLFGDLGGKRTRRTLPPPPQSPLRDNIEVRRELTQAHVVVAHPFPSASDRLHAARCAMAVLAGRDISRIRWEVREQRGLSYAVDGEYGFGAGWGYMGVYLAPEAQRATEAVDVIRRELARLAAGELEQRELDEVLTWIRALHLRELESPTELAVRMAGDELVLGENGWILRQQRLDEVGVEDVVAVASDHLRDREVVSRVLPLK